jgi:hypothetical protein
MAQEVVIGTETYSAKDDYLKTVTNLLMKINSAADGKELKEIAQSMNFITDVLISTVLNPTIRDQLKTAKNDIYELELIKIKMKKGMDYNITTEQEAQAQVRACTEIVGEIRNVLDKYYGFEIRNAVMI